MKLKGTSKLIKEASSSKIGIHGGLRMTHVLIPVEAVERGDVLRTEEAVDIFPKNIGGVLKSLFLIDGRHRRFFKDSTLPTVDPNMMLDENDKTYVYKALNAVAEEATKHTKAESLNIPITRDSDCHDSKLKDSVLWYYTLILVFGLINRINNEEWFIYRMSFFIHRSCAPNCFWRFTDNNLLQLVALMDIPPGTELSVAPDVELFSSQSFRRSVIFKRFGFLCNCIRCLLPYDFSRRMWCPCCREKMKQDQTFRPKHAPFAFPLYSQESWSCQNCIEPLKKEIISGGVEVMAETCYSSLCNGVSSMAEEHWEKGKQFLEKIIKETMGPYHWLNIGLHFLNLRRSLVINEDYTQVVVYLDKALKEMTQLLQEQSEVILVYISIF